MGKNAQVDYGSHRRGAITQLLTPYLSSGRTGRERVHEYPVGQKRLSAHPHRRKGDLEGVLERLASGSYARVLRWSDCFPVPRRV
jgi:hypothetical protein